MKDITRSCVKGSAVRRAGRQTFYFIIAFSPQILYTGRREGAADAYGDENKNDPIGTEYDHQGVSRAAWDFRKQPEQQARARSDVGGRAAQNRRRTRLRL